MLLATLVALSLVAGCENEAPKTSAQPSVKGATGITGKVVETIKAARYTYVRVDTGLEKVWAATPEFQGKVGDMVVVPKGLAMPNYHSETLNRDFDMVYFVGAIRVEGKEQSLSQQSMSPSMHPPIGGAGTEPQVEISGVEKAKDGKTVAEIFASKGGLAGKAVLVRGRVVKFSPNIMGKNWLHVQDGSGSEGTNDLTVTTDGIAKVGDLVLISGVVSVDRDFGFGYKYPVILEDAKVMVE
jgi:hypothetical protein